MKELTELGEKYGFTGEDLRVFVQEEQVKERDQRLRERKADIKKLEVQKELELEKLKCKKQN
jgi:hypothetical protein